MNHVFNMKHVFFSKHAVLTFKIMIKIKNQTSGNLQVSDFCGCVEKTRNTVKSWHTFRKPWDHLQPVNHAAKTVITVFPGLTYTFTT